MFATPVMTLAFFSHQGMDNVAAVVCSWDELRQDLDLVEEVRSQSTRIVSAGFLDIRECDIGCKSAKRF